jgi:DNA-binding NarL/FixJ family response regulator
VTALLPDITVLVCDDDAMIREALRDVLDAQPDVRVVALAGDVEQALALARRYTPSVVLLDVRMPGGGAPAAREILVRSPDTRILAFSAHGDPDTVSDMRGAGASEYLLKGVPNQDIIAAVRRLGRPPAATVDQCSESR